MDFGYIMHEGKLMVLHSVHDGRYLTEKNWANLEAKGAMFDVREGWIWVYLPKKAGGVA